MQRMNEALALAQRSQDEEVLDLLLWCFDHGSEHDRHFEPVRLSFLIGYLAEASKSVTRGDSLMRERWLTCESLLERGFSPPDVWTQLGRLSEYVALGQAFGDPERTFNTLEKLLQLSPEQLGGEKSAFVTGVIKDMQMRLQNS